MVNFLSIWFLCIFFIVEKFILIIMGYIIVYIKIVIGMLMFFIVSFESVLGIDGMSFLSVMFVIIQRVIYIERYFLKKFNFFFLFIFIFVGLNEVLNKRVFKIKGGNVDEMFFIYMVFYRLLW